GSPFSKEHNTRSDRECFASTPRTFWHILLADVWYEESRLGGKLFFMRSPDRKQALESTVAAPALNAGVRKQRQGSGSRKSFFPSSFFFSSGLPAFGAKGGVIRSKPQGSTVERTKGQPSLFFSTSSNSPDRRCAWKE
ncbi:conserved hypothetical protein, partial [Ricinus communis]